jgi:hypothetical protein
MLMYMYMYISLYIYIYPHAIETHFDHYSDDLYTVLEDGGPES